MVELFFGAFDSTPFALAPSAAKSLFPFTRLPSLVSLGSLRGSGSWVGLKEMSERKDKETGEMHSAIAK